MKSKTTHLFQYVLLGLQHVFTMNVYVAPMILAQLLGLGSEHTTVLIQMTFLAAGLATLIQVSVGIGLPVMQGPSFVPLGALAAVGKQFGLPAMLGSMVPGALGIIALSFPLKALGSWARHWITPLVGGTITLVIGISLIPLTFQTLSALPGPSSVNFGVALLTGVSLLTLGQVRAKSQRIQGILQSTSVMIALAIGTLVLGFFQPLSLTLTQSSPWLALPSWLPFGAPQFRLEPILVMTLVYSVILIESIGTWYVVGSVIHRPIDETLVNRGGFGQGLGCLTSALVGGTPVTGYSANAGILAITQNFSKWVGVAAGGLLLALGLAPKLIQIFAAIPSQAMLGVFLAACCVIAYNGYLLVRTFGSSLRVKIQVGVPVLISVAASLIPTSWLQDLPPSVSAFLSSGICVGAVATLILNRLLHRN